MPSSRITSLCWKGYSSHLLRVLEQNEMIPGTTYNNIRTWYVHQHFLFDFPFHEIYRRLLFFTLGRMYNTLWYQVRVQSPSGLALVMCVLGMVDLSGQLRCWITHPWYRNMFLFFICGTLRMLVRPAMKRLFCLKAKNTLGRFAPRSCLIITNVTAA